MRPSLLALAAALALGACGPSEGPPAEPPVADAPAGADDGAPVLTVRALTPGDRACYVRLEDAQGAATEEMAAFEVCEREALVGRRVRVTRQERAVMAASCEGDPACPDTETVLLVTAVEEVD